MSEPVAVEELASVIERYGPAPFLLTTGDDGRPHATNVVVDLDGSVLHCGLGRRTARNGAARPLVSLVWAPPTPGDYTLIVDGDLEVVDGDDGPVGHIAVTHAILHRPADTPTPGPCDADCVDVELG